MKSSKIYYITIIILGWFYISAEYSTGAQLVLLRDLRWDIEEITKNVMSFAFGHFGILVCVLQCFPCGAATRCTLSVKNNFKKSHCVKKHFRLLSQGMTQRKGLCIWIGGIFFLCQELFSYLVLCEKHDLFFLLLTKHKCLWENIVISLFVNFCVHGVLQEETYKPPQVICFKTRL